MSILRSCALTRKKKDKKDLLRIVKTPSGEVKFDPTYSIFGRGAYLCKDAEIIKLAKAKNVLARALRCKVNDDIYDTLLAYVKED